MLKAKTKRKLKKGTRVVTKFVESTGIPKGYATTVAWFAERMAIATFALIVLSFAAGAIFVIKLAGPIGQSKLYNSAADTAVQAEEGIKVFSQQVVDLASPIFTALIRDNREEKIAAQRIAVRKEQLKAYFEEKNSPFAEDDEALQAFAESRNMKLMVAISFVESTFGKNCYYYNCSGIGGTPPKLRRYNSYAEWIRDFDQLLEDRYKGLEPEEFVGIYVVPGSPNWIYGVKQVIKEFEEQDIG